MDKLDGRYNSVDYNAYTNMQQAAKIRNIVHFWGTFDPTVTLTLETQNFMRSSLAQCPSVTKVWSNSVNKYSRYR